MPMEVVTVPSSDREEIERVYASYRQSPAVARRRDPTRAGNRLIGEERDKWWADAVRNLDDLRHPIRVLDVGCGSGDRMSWARATLGPDALVCGIDLLVGLFESSHEHMGTALRGDATALPFDDGAFDLVLLSTFLSSVPSPETRHKIISEVKRVAGARESEDSGRKTGHVLWYDMRLTSPKNRNMRGVGIKELHSLFDGDDVHTETLTLLPPLARVLAPISPALVRTLSKIAFLRSHYAAVIKLKS